MAISVEDPSPVEGKGAYDREGENVIDLAEYFESESLKDAELVRYMQLKHSPLHANEQWAASGLR